MSKEKTIWRRNQEKEDTGKKRHLIDVNKQGVDVWFSLGSRRCFWWVFRLRYVKCEQLNRCQGRKRFGDGTKRKKTLTKKAPNWRYKWSRYDHARCGTVEPRFTDSSLIRKVFLVLSPYIFCKFNPLNTNTPLIRTLSKVPSVSVLTGFDYIGLRSRQYTDKSR